MRELYIMGLTLSHFFDLSEGNSYRLVNVAPVVKLACFYDDKVEAANIIP